MNLQEMIQKYIKNGYSDEFASSKVSQDLILTAIANSKYIQNITIKGGVVMHNLSNDKRRATRDLDLDFIKYSLDNNSIINFISELNNSINSINFEIMDEIVSLHHHKLIELEQEQYMFDFSIINLGANLLINSPEQIFTEKMKSLLKFNIRSTRYKDIFDFYYLIDNKLLNKEKLEKCFKILIYDDKSINVNNVKDLINQFEKITSSRLYKINLNNPKYNWLDKNIDDVIGKIKNYLITMEIVTI